MTKRPRKRLPKIDIAGIPFSGERPDLMQQALAMEDQALTTEKHDLRTVRGLGRHWSWRELLEAAQEERDKMAEAPVEACIICNDGACE